MANPIKPGMKAAQEMGAQMRLLMQRIAENQKIMDTIPEAFRGFLNPKGQTIKSQLAADTQELAKLKARASGARALPLAAGAATAAALSEDEAEAGIVSVRNLQKLTEAARRSLKLPKFHGTAARWPFPEAFDDARQNPWGYRGQAHYVTDSERAAERISKEMGGGSNPGVIEVELDVEEPLDYGAKTAEYINHLVARVPKGAGEDSLKKFIKDAPNNWEALNRYRTSIFRRGEEPAPIRDLMLESGHDSATGILHDYPQGMTHREWAVPFGKQIRRITGVAGAAATGAALSEGEAEAAGPPKVNYLSEAFRQMFSSSLKNLDEKKLVSLAQKYIDEADRLFKEITSETPHQRASRIKEGRERPSLYSAPEEVRNKYQEASEKSHLARRELKNRGLTPPGPTQITEEQIKPIVEQEMRYLRTGEEARQQQVKTISFLKNHAQRRTNDQLLKDYWRISDKDLYAGGKPLTETEYLEANVYGEELMSRGVDPADHPSKLWLEAKNRNPPRQPTGPKLVEPPPKPMTQEEFAQHLTDRVQAGGDDLQRRREEALAKLFGKDKPPEPPLPFKPKGGSSKQMMPVGFGSQNTDASSIFGLGADQGQEQQMPVNVNPPSNPTSGRLIDQLRGQPYRDRFSDAMSRGGDLGLGQEVTPEMEAMRQRILQEWMEQYGDMPARGPAAQLPTDGSPVPQPTPGIAGGGGPLFPDPSLFHTPTGTPMGGTDASMGGGKVPFRFPPPPAGAIPQDQVEGFDRLTPKNQMFPAGDPRALLEGMVPGLGQEVHERYVGTGKVLAGSPKQTAAAVATDFAADVGDVGKFLNPMDDMFGEGPGGFKPEFNAPVDKLRPMAERAIQRLIDQNPEQERTIRDAVEIMSIMMPIPGGKGLTKAGRAKAAGTRAAGKGAIGIDATKPLQAVDPWAAQAAQAPTAAPEAGSWWSRTMGKAGPAAQAAPTIDPLVAEAANLQHRAEAAAKILGTMKNADPADYAVAEAAYRSAQKASDAAAKAAGIPTVGDIVRAQKAAGGKITYKDALDIRNAILRGEIQVNQAGQVAQAAQQATATAKAAVNAATKVAGPFKSAERLPSPTTGLGKAVESVRATVGTLRNKFASLPGSRPDVARLFKDKAVKKALTKGLAGSEEAFHNMAESIRVGGVQKMRDVIEAMHRVTKGDPKELAKLGALLSRASAGKTPKAVDILLKNVDPNVRKTFDAALDYFDNQVETLARINGMSKEELALFKKFGGRDKLTFYDAIRNPNRIKQVRGSAAWDRLYELIERSSATHVVKGGQRVKTTLPRDQIIGEMEQMLKEEVVRSYQETGRLPNSFLNTNPTLKSVQGMKATDPLLRQIFGEVTDFPTQFELGIRTLSTRIAREHVGSKLVQDFHNLGLSNKSAFPGSMEVPAKFAPKGAGKTFMPEEIVNALEFGERIGEDVSHFGMASSAWRVGKTVGSPTSAGVTNFLSNLGDAVADGAALDPDFWITDLPDAVKAGSEVVGRGAARKAQAFERGLAGQGLGAGSVSGELTQHMQRGGLLGDLTEGRRYEKAPRRLKGFTRGLQRFFEQGDVVPKRAIAPRRVHQMRTAMQNAAPEEIAAMNRIFGSANPVTVVSERLRNLFQTYTRVPTGLREFSRKHPIAGAFVSFPVEMARNSVKHFDYLGKEMKMALASTTPEVRAYWAKEAMKHAAGMTVAYGVIPGVVKETMQAAYGYVMTDDQTEVINERGVPEHDRGNVAVLDRNGDEITYSPLGRVDYFNQLHKAANAAMGLAASIYKGDVSRIDDGVIDTMMQTVGQLVPYQEPTGMLYELATNTKLEGNVLESIITGARGLERQPLSTGTNPTDRLADWVKKSALPTALPTTLLQAGRLAGGAKFSDVSPVGTTKKTNMAISMRREANQLANEKDNLYVARLGKLSRDKEMSVEAKRRAVDQMREDWNNGLGQRMFDTARAWDKVFPRSRVLTEMERVGQYHLGVILNDGRVPLFDEVFAASIPPEVRRR